MIAFRVQLNSAETVTAGAPGRESVLVSAGSLVRDPRYQPLDAPPIDLWLHVGGFRQGAEDTQRVVEWLDRRLKVGDEISISVVDVDEADISPPASERATAEVTESGERKQLAYLIRKYGLR